jgi:hypothetical protein
VKFKLAGDQPGTILGVGVLDYSRSLRWLQFIDSGGGGDQFDRVVLVAGDEEEVCAVNTCS